ncbi:MAG: bifunctional riboflavin kinase/FAD synthetase [Planctomyces sp.]|nr:bifunctional riboflavin kinase/FAD synthetase [Planctomyces sp.]
MDLQYGFERPSAYRGGFLSIGNFDGVHRGHQAMASRLTTLAREAQRPSVVLTFDPPPAAILAPGNIPPRLTTPEQKAALLAAQGVDCVIVYPTDRSLLQLPPERFFQVIIREEFAARGLVEGPNFRFGRDRTGDVDTLREYCDAAGMRLEVIAPATEAGGRLISSTDVRAAILEGRVDDARRMLGRPYAISGTVGEGARRGRSIGFPTANLEAVETLLPHDGVYAGRCLAGGRVRGCAVNIGPNPTFGEGARKIEAHLVDFEGDLYGQPLTVEFLRRIRDVRRFEHAEALRSQLELDVERAREANEAEGLAP